MTEQNNAVATVAQMPVSRPAQMEMIELDDTQGNLTKVFTTTERFREVKNELGVTVRRELAGQTIKSRKAKEIAQMLGLVGKAHAEELANAVLIESDQLKHKMTQMATRLDSDDKVTGHSYAVSIPKSGVKVLTFKLVECVRPDKLQKEIDMLKKAYGKTEEEILAMMRAQLASNAGERGEPINVESTTAPTKPEETEAPKAPVAQQQRRR